ncbi:MAG: SprB repeat-containing protein [Saprospiraceae bacterium]|nr:SprB repeat-containing protein [Saprospiraceae bacterium]
MKKFLIILFIAGLLVNGLKAQTRWFVSQNASGSNNGSSWQDAYTNMHTALENAQSGDSVWVAEGVYKPTTGYNRDSSFVLPSGIRLFGGFVGTEANIQQRNWQMHPTVLSGNIGNPDDSTDNAYTIMYSENPDSGTVVDGFYFRHGIANNNESSPPASSPKKCGGALYIMGQDGWAYLDVQNCVFEYNYAFLYGGAVYVNGTGVGSVAPRFLHCTFRYNRARIDGGGIYRNGSSWAERIPDFGNCVFENNEAFQRGGGVYFSDRNRIDTLDFSNCLFVNNIAVNADGGGLYVRINRQSGSMIRIVNSIWDRNIASRGPALSLQTTTFNSLRLFFIDSCTFQFNERIPISTTSAASLIAIDDVADSATLSLLQNSRFYYNSIVGKLIYTTASGGDQLIENNIFYGNTSTSVLGAGSLSPGYSVITKNALIQNICEVVFSFGHLDNRLFYNNLVVQPGGAFLTINYDTIHIFNNTIYSKSFFTLNSQGTAIGSNSSKCTLLNSVFLSTDSMIDYFNINQNDLFVEMKNNAIVQLLECPSSPQISCGPGNLFGIDPLFVNPDSNDYHLQPCSPLRDAGTNAAVPPYLLTDLDGRPRILGGTVDIGAYEIPNFAATTEPIASGACTDAANGSVTFETEGGCAPFTFLWQPGNGGGTTATGLAPGTYTFTVTDAAGRMFLDTVTVPALPAPEIRADSMPISCYGQADASLAVAPFSGPEPFTFQWTGGVTDSIFGPVGPGVWTVTATDANGCSTTYTYYLTAPDSLQFATAVQDATGPTEPDGSVTVTSVQGGTGPYGYLWSDGSTDAVLANVPPGIYTVTITDDRGCTAVWTYEVSFTIGTGEAGTSGTFRVFPNPAHETLWLELEGLSGTLGMYDAQGRRVFWQAAVSGLFQIPIEGFAPGAHVVVLYDAEGKPVRERQVVLR